MKLYTEEQVITFAIKVLSDYEINGTFYNREKLKETLDVTPIEIPSDLQDFHKWIEDNEWYFNPISFNGVIQYRWVKEFWCGQETTNELYKIFIEEQILNQNK